MDGPQGAWTDTHRLKPLNTIGDPTLARRSHRTNRLGLTTGDRDRGRSRSDRRRVRAA